MALSKSEHPAFIDAKTASREQLINWLAAWYVSQAYPHVMMKPYLDMRTTRQLKRNYIQIEAVLKANEADS